MYNINHASISQLIRFLDQASMAYDPKSVKSSCSRIRINISAEKFSICVQDIARIRSCVLMESVHKEMNSLFANRPGRINPIIFILQLSAGNPNSILFDSNTHCDNNMNTTVSSYKYQQTKSIHFAHRG